MLSSTSLPLTWNVLTPSNVENIGLQAGTRLIHSALFRVTFKVRLQAGTLFVHSVLFMWHMHVQCVYNCQNVRTCHSVLESTTVNIITKSSTVQCFLKISSALVYINPQAFELEFLMCVWSATFDLALCP